MGRTGYSTQENVNNIETVHLHFGLELIFDESQKECNSEIWIDVYHIVRLLNRHRGSGSTHTGIWTRRTGRSLRVDPHREKAEAGHTAWIREVVRLRPRIPASEQRSRSAHFPAAQRRLFLLPTFPRDHNFTKSRYRK